MRGKRRRKERGERMRQLLVDCDGARIGRVEEGERADDASGGD